MILFLIFSKCLFAQESFQVTQVQDDSTFFWDLQADDEIVVYSISKQRNFDYVISNIDPAQPYQIQGIQHTIKRLGGGNLRLPGSTSDFSKLVITKSKYSLLARRAAVFVYDKITKNHWVKTYKNISIGEFISHDISATRVGLLGHRFADAISLYQFDTDSGTLLDKKEYTHPAFERIRGNSADLVNNPIDDSWIISGNYKVGADSGFMVLKIDENGLQEKGITIKDHYLTRLHWGDLLTVAPNGDVVIATLFRENGMIGYDLLLARFDKDLNLIYSKRLSAERFRHISFAVNFDEVSNLYLASGTIGTFPIILSKIDKQGEIISETGYALNFPTIAVTNKGELVMATNTHFDDQGNTFLKKIIAKTDSLGQIENCQNYQAQLKSIDYPIELSTFSVTQITDDAPELESGTATVKPYSADFEDFCDFPPPPHPNFHLRDTICLGECVQTDSTTNANAHSREWTLETDNQSLTVEDSLNFNYCFSESGTYTLRQTIWFLGVDYSFEKIIEVMPPLEIDIQSDSILCDLPPINLGLSSNRELKNIRWNTGSDSTSVSIYEGGFYSVLADDGYCRAGDSALYEFVFEKIDTNLALQLPDTSTVCEVHLPLQVRPLSAYTSLFENEMGDVDSVFNISRKGDFKFKTIIHNCDFTQSTFVQIDECKADIFTPAAFSPNDDGINDEFLPLGADIEPIRLQIYDRWGGLLFESTDGQLGWRAVDSPKGVYVFRFEYVNLLTGLEEEISGDVTVVR